MKRGIFRIEGVNRCKSLFISGVCLLSGIFVGHGQVPAGEEGVGPFRTQTIQLEAGWNAVYLEIEPLKGDPSALFEGTPIEIAASYFRPVSPMGFIDSPDEVLPDRKGWGVWYAPTREDGVLTNLHAIQAHNSYLLFAKEAYVWSLRGTPFHGAAEWHPNAFNLVGFPIDAAEQPTIAAFFSGAEAHSPLKIYRMTGGHWALITNPAGEMMKPGASYWVYSEGASEFRGPLDVEYGSSAAGGVVFDEATTSRPLEIRNVSPFPQSLTLTLEAGTAGPLPVTYAARLLDGPNQPIETVAIPFPTSLTLGPLEPGQAFLLDLGVAQEAVTAPVTSATLSISSTAGIRIDVPLISVRVDLLGLP